MCDYLKMLFTRSNIFFYGRWLLFAFSLSCFPFILRFFYRIYISGTLDKGFIVPVLVTFFLSHFTNVVDNILSFFSNNFTSNFEGKRVYQEVICVVSSMFMIMVLILSDLFQAAIPGAIFIIIFALSLLAHFYLHIRKYAKLTDDVMGSASRLSSDMNS